MSSGAGPRAPYGRALEDKGIHEIASGQTQGDRLGETPPERGVEELVTGDLLRQVERTLTGGVAHGADVHASDIERDRLAAQAHSELSLVRWDIGEGIASLDLAKQLGGGVKGGAKPACGEGVRPFELPAQAADRAAHFRGRLGTCDVDGAAIELGIEQIARAAFGLRALTEHVAVAVRKADHLQLFPGLSKAQSRLEVYAVLRLDLVGLPGRDRAEATVNTRQDPERGSDLIVEAKAGQRDRCWFSLRAPARRSVSPPWMSSSRLP